MSPNRERVLLVQANGSERKISVTDAKARIIAGTANHAGYKNGLSCVVECRQAMYRDRSAHLWVKDRGVTGGRYGRPFEPNGNSAQMTLVQQ